MSNLFDAANDVSGGLPTHFQEGTGAHRLAAGRTIPLLYPLQKVLQREVIGSLTCISQEGNKSISKCLIIPFCRFLILASSNPHKTLIAVLGNRISNLNFLLRPFIQNQKYRTVSNLPDENKPCHRHHL